MRKKAYSCTVSVHTLIHIYNGSGILGGMIISKKCCVKRFGGKRSSYALSQFTWNNELFEELMWLCKERKNELSSADKSTEMCNNYVDSYKYNVICVNFGEVEPYKHSCFLVILNLKLFLVYIKLSVSFSEKPFY